MLRSRWWSVDDLRATEETVFPERLAELIEQLTGEHRTDT